MPARRRPEPLCEKEIVEIVIGYVFREQAMKELAGIHGVSNQTIRRRLETFDVTIRPPHEQRHCDRKHGRYSQAEAVKAAWKRGAYDTDAYRNRCPTPYDRRGEKNSFYGKHHSRSTRCRLSAAAQARCRPGTGSYGEDWTDDLRERIIARDGDRCQICGASKAMLQVHHVNHDRRDNSEANLITVCAGCHLAYHGRGELTEEMAAAQSRLVRSLSHEHPMTWGEGATA